MKVLICEDDRLMARAMQIVLENAGYNVDIAVDGNIATDYIESETFSAIIVDIHLPYTSGLELIGNLRNELRSKVPIIVVSAISDDVIQKQALLLGADKYMLKPCDLRELVAEVNRLLNN
jgi:DNA-binding response OmpR family regulator